MASMQRLLLLLLSVTLASFVTVFGEELETLPPSSPHYPYPHPHPPTPAPAPAPHHHGRHHHHHHPPAPAPAPHHYPPTPTPSPVKPPAHPYPPPPTPSPVVKPPPSHHYPPSPPPPTPSPVVKPPPSHHYPPPPTPTPSPVVKPPPSHHYPPVPAPAPPKPPTHHYYPPSIHPFPRSFVTVQGVVYIKSCKYAGVDTLLGASPALGAVVKLQCNNSKYSLEKTVKTDKNGYFYLEAPKTITTYGAHKCKVFLVSSATYEKPSNLHGGIVGATLKPEKPFVSYKLPFLLYTVGPLAFEPKC